MTTKKTPTNDAAMDDQALTASAPTKSIPPSLPSNPDITTVTFDKPIARGDQFITSVNINKPKTGALRGLSLADIMKLEVDAVIKLVPRISTPPLAEHEVAELDPVDFMHISTAVIGFFATAEQRKAAQDKLAMSLDYPTA